MVADIGDGIMLVTLLEILSEKKFAGKLEKNPKLRVQKIDNINNALNFCWLVGVQVLKFHFYITFFISCYFFNCNVDC